MLTQEQKQNIVHELEDFIDRTGSQNKAAKKLNTSSATLHNMLNEKWEHIEDGMWRKIAGSIGYNPDGWEVVITKNYEDLIEVLSDCKNNSMTMGVIGDSGSGKTQALKNFEQQNQNVILLRCEEAWNKKYFLNKLMSALGRNGNGLTVYQLVDEVEAALTRMYRPIILIDEADKLSDQVLYFFITFYNRLEDQCGIVMIATDHLKKRIDQGLESNKKGYQEIYSRIGRRFFELSGVNSTDITQICVANGITDKKDIRSVVGDSKMDLRRVKRKIFALKKKKKKTEVEPQL